MEKVPRHNSSPACWSDEETFRAGVIISLHSLIYSWLADVQWRTPPVLSWLDPANWRSSTPPSDQAAVPHLERIPCGQDVAVFQSGAFQVKLPEFAVRVGAIDLDGVSEKHYRPR